MWCVSSSHHRWLLLQWYSCALVKVSWHSLSFWSCIYQWKYPLIQNKANLRDLIAATSLVILLKLDSNSRFFSRCDAWPRKAIGHLFYTNSSFVHHFKSIGEFKLEILSRSTEIGDFLSCATLKFDGWPRKTIGYFFYTASSFVHHFIAICEFELELQSGNAQFGSKSMIFLAVWPWNLTDDHEKFYGTSPNPHQALCIILSTFHWPLTLTFCMDLTSVINLTPENFMKIRWWEYSEKGVTDGETDWTIHHSAAWLRLKITTYANCFSCFVWNKAFPSSSSSIMVCLESQWWSASLAITSLNIYKNSANR